MACALFRRHALVRLAAAVAVWSTALVPVTSANRIPSLQTKKAEREKVIDFTAAYSPFFQAVFAAKSVAIKSAADLAGKSVAVTRGAMEDLELSKIAPAKASGHLDKMAMRWLGRPAGELPQ